MIILQSSDPLTSKLFIKQDNSFVQVVDIFFTKTYKVRRWTPDLTHNLIKKIEGIGYHHPSSKTTTEKRWNNGNNSFDKKNCVELEQNNNNKVKEGSGEWGVCDKAHTRIWLLEHNSVWNGIKSPSITTLPSIRYPTAHSWQKLCSLRGHHRHEFFVIHLTITIDVCFSDHFVDFFVSQFFTKVGHDMT